MSMYLSNASVGPTGVEPGEFIEAPPAVEELVTLSWEVRRSTSVDAAPSRNDHEEPSMTSEWGPLAALVGEWEGDAGLDTAYSHSRGEVMGTPYRERATFTPFGPVRNGGQQLFGLDYRTAMWRDAETSPFHTEVGYWLWDPASGEVLRSFAVPRGIAVLAGGTATPEAVSWSLAADLGGSDYTISENRYLAERASSQSYRATITVNADGSWSYHQVTMLKMRELPGPFAHTDWNTLHRVH